MLLLLNLRTIHPVGNVLMEELLSLLCLELLQKGNKMLATTYEAFILVKTCGLSYDSIHACTNGCVCFLSTLSNHKFVQIVISINLWMG
jgi:hypothetical protein